MRWLILGLLLAGGCATDPLSQLETATPTLTPSQVRELHQHTHDLSRERVNELVTATNAIVSLVKVPTDDPAQCYRVPVILATVAGRANVRVLLDSGSNRNLFGYSLAHSLGLPLVAGQSALTSQGIGGAVSNYLAVVPTFAVGPLEGRNLLALIGPDAQALSLTRNFWGRQPAMILGVNALRGLAFLSINNRHGTVTFGVGQNYRPDPTAEFMTAVPLRWENELPVVDIVIEKQWAYPCIVDTGGDYGLLVPRATAKMLGYWKPASGTVDASSGIAGAALGASYEVRQATVGEATLVKIPARTTVTGPEPAGGRLLLGNVVLRRYRVTFDFRNSVLWLER